MKNDLSEATLESCGKCVHRDPIDDEIFVCDIYGVCTDDEPCGHFHPETDETNPITT